MNKFIFVCYDHGTGGENLSLKISQKDYCETLKNHAQGGRTWTNDVFEKSLLSVTESWHEKISNISHCDLWRVVPSHRTPDEIKQHLPNSLFVVINYPVDSQQINHLQNRIYKKVWMTSLDSLKQKIGFCEQYNYEINTKEKLQDLNKALNNAHIHCIMNDVEYTDANSYELFRKIVKVGSGMRYKDDEKTIALEYNAFDEQKLDRLDELCILHR